MTTPGRRMTSDEWDFVKKWATEELEKVRTQILHPGLGLAETEALRGRAGALSELLSLGQPDDSRQAAFHAASLIMTGRY